MKPKRRVRRLSLGVLGAAGVCFLTGCETAEIQAVVAGVELVADTLVGLDNGNSRTNNISFGDWLLDELRE